LKLKPERTQKKEITKKSNGGDFLSTFSLRNKTKQKGQASRRTLRSQHTTQRNTKKTTRTRLEKSASLATFHLPTL